DALRELLAVGPDTLALDPDSGAVREGGVGSRIVWVDSALGAKPRDGPIHETAVDERKAEHVGYSLSHRRLARGDPAVDGDDHWRPAALRSAAISPSRSTRQFPGKCFATGRSRRYAGRRDRPRRCAWSFAK